MKFFTTAFVILFLGASVFAKGPYAPAADSTGCTAVYKDSSILKSWASGIEVKRGLINLSDAAATYNGSNYATFGINANALGKAQESSFDVVSLGDGGSATVTFDRPLANGQGADFAVFENSFGNFFLELAFVEVSSDGKRFFRFPAVSLTPVTEQVGNFSQLDPTNIYNFAGKYRQGFGTPFDLEDLKDSTGLDLNNIRFVRVRDVVGSIDKAYASYDSKGNIINDPWPSAFHSSGFDLDAVGLINAGQEYKISTFDELELSKDAYWNGADKSGGFSSGLAFFTNDYNADWGSWSGFAYSNMRDDSTEGYGNQYSAITAGGINAPDTGGTNYVVAYVSGYSENTISFSENSSHIVSGMYVTNGTYTYLSMKNGDAFSKKFGGVTGNDADYLKLQFWGERADGSKTDTIDFFLADFRSADNSKDYIVDSWKWVDLYQLGKISKIHFQMSSTDNGDWGMNTPSYFCLDNLSILPDDALTLFSPIADVKVNENAPSRSISLASVFTAYDLSGVTYQLESNSNEGLVSTSLNGGSVSLSFAKDKSGEAEIVVSATFGDVLLKDTFMVYVEKTNSIPSEIAGNISVFPNPFVSSIHVESELNSHIALFDMTGRLLLQNKSENGNAVLNVNNLLSGSYIIKISNSKGVKSLKVVKK